MLRLRLSLFLLLCLCGLLSCLLLGRCVRPSLLSAADHCAGNRSRTGPLSRFVIGDCPYGRSTRRASGSTSCPSALLLWSVVSRCLLFRCLLFSALSGWRCSLRFDTGFLLRRVVARSLIL